MQVSNIVVLAALAVSALIFDGGARANPVRSHYTTIDIKSCQKVDQHPDGATWSCPGLPGYPVWLAEGDLRTFISVGADAAKRRAAEQTLAAFNSIFRKGSSRTTLEWRFARSGSALVPYATILRYFTSNDTGQGQVLVVSKVTRTETCHMAYIDALATPDPMVLAHKIADENARAFDCRKKPMTVGVTGRSPM
jgi:hypothetical protein